MSSILDTIGNFEKELTLLEGILQNILLFDPAKNELTVNLKFDDSGDFDPSIIGGLAATINEFVAFPEETSTRTIKLELLKLIFTLNEGILTIFCVDPSYETDQYAKAIEYFREVLVELLQTADGQNERGDEIAISIQMLMTLLSEEIEIDFELGEAVAIYPFRMKEIAETRTTKLIGANLEEDEIASAPGQSTGEIDASGLPVEGPEDPELLSKNEALQSLLAKFSNTFTDCLQITLIRFSEDGSLSKVSSGRLDTEVEDKLYTEVLSMMGTIVTFLSRSEEDRTIDLEDKWIFFQSMSEKSFVYIVVDNLDVLDLIKPLIERISLTINKLFPTG